MSFLTIHFAVAVVVAAVDPAAPPRSLDARLVLDRIAAEPTIVTPTGLTVDRRGRILVIESHTHFRPQNYHGPAADRIRLLDDTDGDGRFERIQTFFEGLRMTMNLGVASDGSIFVATRSAIYRLWDRDGDGQADRGPNDESPQPIVWLDSPGDYPHNGLSGFAFDFTGDVYFGLGENLGAEYRLIGSDGTTLSGGGEGGNIYRCQRDGSRLERVATGFWNPFHLTFDPYGRLFAVDNDPDSRPPCRLLQIVTGGDYGYRFRNGRKGVHPFTAWNGELPGTLPMVAGTGEAPSGIVVYESDNLPEEYRGSLLVTSWGDHRIERYRLEPRGASFRSQSEPVVVGGDNFRPVGIAQAPDGSLFISDWVDKSYELHGKGRVWRLRARQARDRMNFRTEAESLAHPDRNIRERAANRLVKRGPEGREALEQTVLLNRDPRARAVALQALVASGILTADLARRVVCDPADDLRQLAVRCLPADLVDLAVVAGSDPSPAVRSEALRRLQSGAAREVLLQALETDDPFLMQAAREGLRKSVDLTELITLACDEKPARRLGALVLLRDLDFPDGPSLVKRFLNDVDPTIRLAAIQWIGERRLEGFRPLLLRQLESGIATRELLESTLAAIEFLDRKPGGPREEIAGEDLVAELFTRSSSPAVLRRALRLIRPDHPAITLEMIQRFLDSADESLRLEAVRTLSAGTIEGRFEVLDTIAADPEAPEPLRLEAIVGLAYAAEARRDRLLELARSDRPAVRREAIRGLRRTSLTPSEWSLVLAASGEDPESLALLKMVPAPAPVTESPSPRLADRDQGRSLPPSTDLDSWLARLEGAADPSAGQRVFFHPLGPGCFRCHQVDGRGGRAGPDLTNVMAGMDRPRLLQSILQPNLEIAPQFTAWSVARTDGTVFSGVFVGASSDGLLTYVNTAGETIAVPSSEIEDRKPQSVSIMPENLAELMTPQEFRDLLAFLSLPSRD
jgi:putative membrane-bound dehydrogenase-like protein